MHDESHSKSSETRRRGRSALRLIELLVVSGISVILIAILLPALNAARAIAARVVCLRRLRQIMLSTERYWQVSLDGLTHQFYWPKYRVPE
jgi:hypothetical protein